MSASRSPLPKLVSAKVTRKPCNRRISHREKYLGLACGFGVRERGAGPGRVITDKPLTLLLAFWQVALLARRVRGCPFFLESPSVIPHKELPVLLWNCRALPRLL